MSNRQALEGVFYIIKAGYPWHMMPSEYGKPTTIHGKFRKWVKLGIFQKIMDHVLQIYSNTIEDHRYYSIDASFSKAPLSYKWSGKNPTYRGKQGIKKVLSSTQKVFQFLLSLVPQMFMIPSYLKKS